MRYQILSTGAPHAKGASHIEHESDSPVGIAKAWLGLGPLGRRDHILIDSTNGEPMILEHGPDWYRLGYASGGVVAEDRVPLHATA